MKKRIITTAAVIAIAVTTFFIWKNEQGDILGTSVFAVGDLTIDWNVPSGDPIFTVTNALPGDTETRDVIVTNSASVPRDIAVRGDLLEQDPDELIASFSSVLDFTISEGGTDLYGGTSPTGPKTLADFFAETATPSTALLSTLAPGDTTTYTFEVHFQESAGNEYQNAFIIFNLIIGIDTDVPPECEHITFSGPTIFGTSGDDEIRGTLGNDLIFALEGDDYVTSFSGDDCIIGGPGNDELRGETGNDVIFGNEGDDLVVGATGRDLLFGGIGNDTIRGETNNDEIYGNEGNDLITGGGGNDLIHGNGGNDQIFGESGNDVLFGDEDDDSLDGGSGSDTIIGGEGSDTADGKSGTDSCDAEVEISC